MDVLGTDLAVSFLLEFGGAYHDFACKPRETSRLVALVGQENAVALAAGAYRLPRRIPLAKPWIAQVLRSKGLSVNEIARKLHASDNSVRGWLRKTLEAAPPHDHRQGVLPLFDRF